MENFKIIDFSLSSPETSAFYYTDKGYMRYELFTRSFYNNEGFSEKIKYWFKEIKTFEEVVRPAIKYLCENHHPHNQIIITPTGAELVEGQKTTGEILDYLID